MRRAGVLVSAALVLCAVATGVRAQVMKFDFGTAASALAEGYTRVTPESAYSDAAGFGWSTKLRVVPGVPNWWNPDQAGGILSAFDTQKGTAAARDYVLGYHFFGWKHTGEDKDGVNRLGIVMDDDLKTDFVVKVKPGPCSVLVAMGDVNMSHRLRPFHVDVNGQALVRNLSCQTLTYKRASNVACPDGKLTVTFRGAADYKHPYPWNQCTWWMVNMMLVTPTDQEGEIEKELARIQNVQFETLRKAYIPEGVPSKFEIREGPAPHLVKDGKPFLRLLWHGWGWQDTLKVYRLYAWTNTLNLGPGNRQLFYYDDWFRRGWRERAAAEAFPSDWFDQANQAYASGYLVNYYLGRDYMQYLPPSYRQEHPESVAMNVRGQREGGVRYPGEPSGDLYTARVVTVMADLAKLHPASATFELFEEYWVPQNGFNPKAVEGYREWLKAKYGTIDRLNAEWGTTYGGFADVTPPANPHEQSGNNVNHTIWRGEMAARAAKVAYDAIKAADPSRPVAGAKGTFPISSWYYAAPTDIFGWYGHANMAIAEAAGRYFGKMTEPVHVNVCQHQTMRGGIPVDKWPFMNYRESAYSLMLTRVIDGAKSIFNEDYVLGHDFHYFHRTKEMRGRPLEGTLGGKVLIDRDDYPDVYLESKSLQLARVNQLLLRLAPVFLPAKMPRAKVAMLATTESDLHGGVSPYYGNTVMEPVYLFKMLQVPFEVLREPQFDRFADYDVLVLTNLCTALRPETVEGIRKFVSAGGKLLILPPTGTTDARNLKPADFGWETLAGCRVGASIDSGGETALTVTRNDLTTSLNPGDVLPGFEKLQRGKLASLTITDGTALAEVAGTPVAAVSKDRRVVTVCLPQMVAAWSSLGARHFDRNSVRFFADVFDAWEVVRPVALSGAGEAHMFDVGVLEGRDGWLVLAASYSTADQTVNARLRFLPQGSYDVVDVTGERPIIRKDAAGQNVLASDPQFRRSFFVAKNADADVLAKTGLTLEVGAQMGRVLLIRRSDRQVWVNCPGHELQALIEKPVVIVPGTTDADRKAAERVVGWFPRMGIKAEIVPAEKIGTRTVKNEVVIDNFKVADFTSTPIDVHTNLILIGNEATNPVIRHLGAEGTFCFDKVLMKVDAAFPGPGRGVIQVVESVSNEAYDATTNSRDAIILSGSDAAGLNAALNEFYRIGWPRR